MRKNEFLSQLQKALENELDSQKVREHVAFYDNYIQSEIKKGVSEEEVLDQLGDPWAITKTILLSEKMNEQESESEQVVRNEQENTNETGKYNWKMLGVIIALILIVFLVLSVVFGVIAIVIRLAIRFAVPLLVIALVWKFFFKK